MIADDVVQLPMRSRAEHRRQAQLQRNPNSPVEIVVIPHMGRFLWWRNLQEIAFYEKGARRESASWPLTDKQNNRSEAVRKVARILNDPNFGAPKGGKDG